MKISVIIPAYNEEQYIANCLISLKQQTDLPDEIIIVDNNCTDQTVVIAKKYDCLIIKEKKQGMIFARNRGFNEATGDIIARCDADVILPPDWLQKIKENFRKNQIDAVTGPIVFSDLPLNSPLYADFYNKFIKFLQHGKETLNGPNMAITKNIWEKIKDKVCLDEHLVHEDIDLAIHINKAGGKIKRDKTLVVSSSSRRIKKNPTSFFIEYPIRVFKTLRNHKS
jgi:glycosyltransferase involved in cell wall biosynthesis